MTDTVNTRELILDLLLEITRDGIYSHIAIAGALDKYQYLDKRERAFITRITEGTLEHLIQIDFIIDQYSKTPVKKMRPVIRTLLQSSVYQICYMDAVPDAAVCNEAVRLAGKRGFRNLKGFVNGVLRSISRQKTQIPWPDKEKEPERYLSVTYSMPEWIIRLWQQEFAYRWENPKDLAKMEELLGALSLPPRVTVRANPQLCTPEELRERLLSEGVSVEKTCLPYAFAIDGYDYLGALESFREGWFYVQDLSSMLVAETAQPAEGELVLDVCAAPGGKAIHIAQKMGGTGQVLARDLTEQKVRRILENRQRCRVDNLTAQVWDATVFDEGMEERADLVVADVPCSGLGVLRRKKDIRYRMSKEQMEELMSLQRSILATVFRYVKPGGRLLYSTCTIHRGENEENVRWFLDAHEGFTLVSERQVLPGKEEGDGFYIALLKRERT